MIVELLPAESDVRFSPPIATFEPSVRVLMVNLSFVAAERSASIIRVPPEPSNVPALIESDFPLTRSIVPPAKFKVFDAVLKNFVVTDWPYLFVVFHPSFNVPPYMFKSPLALFISSFNSIVPVVGAHVGI